MVTYCKECNTTYIVGNVEEESRHQINHDLSTNGYPITITSSTKLLLDRELKYYVIDSKSNINQKKEILEGCTDLYSLSGYDMRPFEISFFDDDMFIVIACFNNKIIGYNVVKKLYLQYIKYWDDSTTTQNLNFDKKQIYSCLFIGVVSNHRNKGIGKKLLELTLQYKSLVIDDFGFTEPSDDGIRLFKKFNNEFINIV